MSAYPDSSLVVSAFTQEARSDRADRWFAELGTGELASSWWTVTEVASALAAKVRAGSLRTRVARQAYAAIRAMLEAADPFTLVGPRHFDAASTFLLRSTEPLRAGDALHLAIAADAQATVWTFDRGMAQAGQALGLGTRLLE